MPPLADSKREPHRVYNFLTVHKTTKICAIIIILFFPSLLIISYIIATTSTGFNIIQNFVSSLGNGIHTPIPVLFKLNCIISAILLIPINLFLSRIPPQSTYQENPRRYRLGLEGMVFLFVGILGLLMIGIFPETYIEPSIWALHEFWSNVLFIGFTFGAIWYGILIVFYETIIPKPLGFYMMFIPAPTVIFRLLELPPLTPMTYEWIMLIALMIWLAPIVIIIIKHISSNKVNQK